MNLPALEWQFIYGRLAWAIVLASVLVACWPRRRPLTRPVLAALCGASLVLMVLPGQASLAYWVGLAVQWPSGLLLGLCVVKLHAAWSGNRGQALMPLWFAAPLAVAGTALYVDAVGWTTRGMYYGGFGPALAPAIALGLLMLCIGAVLRGRIRPQACAMLVALSGFTLFRLPTGNLWDALFDPLLWCWTVGVVLAAGWRKLRPAATVTATPQ